MKRFEVRERERREDVRIHEQKRDVAAMAAFQAALAPPQAVMDYRREVDQLGVRTVEALMEKEEALAAVREKMKAMLGKAHVLPDGRRVFKTEDGQHVFDEHGQQLPPEEIDPGSIDNKKPKWEAFKAEKDQEVRLEAERQQLFDYQARLDAARERLDKGDITNGELDELKADLAAHMPDAVRQKVEAEKPKADAAPAPPNPAPSLMSDMEGLRRPGTVVAPSIP
ncbi:hypothetical protein [Xanthobacter autotrophicus]|uniref:hypothetical protein n=1 Tax=Xanthobacter autotrophicus TaxID=280 RepID=UPI00372BC04C